MSLLKFVRPVKNIIFDINNPYGLKLLTRLRLGLSHLRYHKFRHNVQACINPLCACDLEIETTNRFLLHCPLFQSARQSILINIKKIDRGILKKHGLAVKALDSHSRGPVFKTTEWLQDQLSLSSFRV